jgi:hypothetical protein
MMFFGGLFMLLFAALVAAVVVVALVGLPMAGAVVWRQATHPSTRRTCVSCGRALQADWRNCPSCGTPVA